MLGQGQGLGPEMVGQQAPDGLMVATPAQTLTDTLDDIMAGEWVQRSVVLQLFCLLWVGASQVLTHFLLRILLPSTALI